MSQLATRVSFRRATRMAFGRSRLLNLIEITFYSVDVYLIMLTEPLYIAC